MFEVRSTSPIDGEWEVRDARIRKAAGRPSDFSGTSHVQRGIPGIREHVWYVSILADAVMMKERLNLIEQVSATVREK